MKTLAAHQPNFCPWGGYIQKIDSVDIFVLMGNVQFNWQLYQNRFRADSNWFTMSVHRDNKFSHINKKKYATPESDWNRIKKSWPKLEMFDSHIQTDLWATNTGIIRQIVKHFDIKTELVNDYETHLKSTDRLIDLCKTFGAEKYLSGSSGKAYLDIKLFEMAGIEVEFQDESNLDRRPLVDMI